MKTHVALGYRNLTRRKSRTVLTMLGVVLAIGFTVGLLSISEGFMQSFDKLYGSAGPEIYVTPRDSGRGALHMHCGGTAMDEREAEIIGAVPGVRVAEPVMSDFASSNKRRGGGEMMRGMGGVVLGVPPDSFIKMQPGAVLEQGRLLADGDEYSLVAGATFAANAGVELGGTVEVEDEPVRVVGVLKQSGDLYDFMGFMPLHALQKLREQEGKACRILVKVDDPSRAGEVKARIKKIYPKRGVMTLDEVVAKAKQVMTMTQAAHFGLSCFALLIGILFVATTMIMSVSERMREFATLRVMGASRSFITKLVMTESLLLSLAGGALGFILGIALSAAINTFINKFFGQTYFHAHVSLKLFLIGFAISVVIGTFAGIFPARMIMKKQLAESLRHE